MSVRRIVRPFMAAALLLLAPVAAPAAPLRVLASFSASVLELNRST
mgnify:CR=1 FL=1